MPQVWAHRPTRRVRAASDFAVSCGIPVWHSRCSPPALVADFAIRARDIRRRFGLTTVLGGVTLDVAAGECVSLLGANGSGKSTFLRIVASVLRPTGGALSVLGHYVVRHPERVRGQVGLVGHGAHVWEDLTAPENLRVWRTLADRDARPMVLMDALTAVLDEPFTGLDQAGKKWLGTPGDKSAIYVGKLGGNLVLMFLVEAVVLALFTGTSSSPRTHWRRSSSAGTGGGCDARSASCSRRRGDRARTGWRHDRARPLRRRGRRHRRRARLHGVRGRQPVVRLLRDAVRAARDASADKAYRVGALVEPGSLRWNPASLDLAFTLTDGQGTIPVRHRGAPPDLFGEGRGAVVEGRWTPEGYLKASAILAKHSEEYRAPEKQAAGGLRTR